MPSERQSSRLVVIAPDWLAGQVIRMRSTRMTVGRGQTDVYLDDPQVSRVHAALIAQDEQLAVEDLGSRSGTTVNGMRVQTPQPLGSGTWLGSARLLLSWTSTPQTRPPLLAPSRQPPVPASLCPSSVRSQLNNVAGGSTPPIANRGATTQSFLRAIAAVEHS